MDFLDLKEYQDRYIKQYLPYRDDRVYQAFSSFFTNTYCKDSYENVPMELKDYIESQLVGERLYNVLLMSVGYPEDFVKSIRSTHKRLILQNLMDYNRYKATLKYVKKVGSDFKEPINIYELYMDYRPISQGKYDWMFIGNPLHLYDDEPVYQYSFDEIYNGTQDFFVSKLSLDNLRNAGSLTLPVKSNLLLLDLHVKSTCDEITNLGAATALFHFRDTKIKMYLGDNFYDITIGDALQLWYYIIYRFAGEIYSSQATQQILLYDISGSSFPYTLNESASNSLKALLEEYEELAVRNEIEKFYDEKIRKIFIGTTSGSSLSLIDLRKRLIYSVGLDLVKYIEERMDNVNSSKALETIATLDEIYDSILNHIYNSGDVLLDKYQVYVLENFSKVLISPQSTITYKLISTFKPYHTQLVGRSKYVLSIGGKFNNQLSDIDRMFIIRDFPASACVISDSYAFSISIETGYFEFDRTDRVKTNIEGISKFGIGDFIYSKDPTVREYPTWFAVAITGFDYLNYEIILAENYQGPIGVFPRAYRRWPEMLLQVIPIPGAFFTFTTVMDANIIHTNRIGFSYFSPGDYIFSPNDTQAEAVMIVKKNSNNYTFELANDYFGKAGVYTRVGKYRPPP